MHVVLVEPEIPQNCGNIARTCVLTGSRLHLVGPLGFDVDDRAVARNMKRCGLDYWPRLDLRRYDSLEDFFRAARPQRLWLATTKAPRRYDRAPFQDGDFLLFGKESAGLSPELRGRYPDRCLRIPMLPGERSLNLSNSVAVMVYEALRQLDFPGFQALGEMSLDDNAI